MQNQKSLTLHGCEFSGWGREHVAIVFASEGGHHLVYGFLQLIASYITEMNHPKSLTLR